MNTTLPHIEERNGKKILVVHGKPQILIAGEIHNSNSTLIEVMGTSWDRAQEVGITTLLTPVTWEMIEPEEGKFTFELVDDLVHQARERGGQLGFLWFGAWKNSQCMYAPEWVKRDTERFKRAEMEKGKKQIRLEFFHGTSYTTLSYVCEATREADARAFAELMKHLKEIDGEANTVVCVQVENETGVMGAPREHSDEADALFAGPAPQGLIDYLRANTEEMDEELRLDVEQGAPSGTWEEVFGGSAEEVFSVYYTASYCNYVAEQGRKEYDLPMTVNCWLKQGPPVTYPTGGPTYQMMEVWEYCAPAIDIFCPDIYVKNFLEICDNYVKRGNPLYIPEAAVNGHVAARLIYCVGHYHAACFAPFGFEDMGRAGGNPIMEIFGGDSTDPLLGEAQSTEEYRFIADALTALTPMLTGAYGTQRLQAVIAERPQENRMDFGRIRFYAMTDLPFFPKKDGACLILQEESEDEDVESFTILVNRAVVSFASVDAECPNIEILSLEQGVFTEDGWKTTLHCNGDEAQAMMYFKPTLLRCRLHLF